MVIFCLNNKDNLIYFYIIIVLMVEFIMENGKMEKEMDKENLNSNILLKQ